MYTIKNNFLIIFVFIINLIIKTNIYGRLFYFV